MRIEYLEKTGGILYTIHSFPSCHPEHQQVLNTQKDRPQAASAPIPLPGATGWNRISSNISATNTPRGVLLCPGSDSSTSGKFFALRVCGHSMEPRILEGDVVIVRQQEDVDSGDIAIVMVNGDEATVKRVKKQEDGITLIATNTSVYEPHFYSNQEIRDFPVRILGKVVELRGKV